MLQTTDLEVELSDPQYFQQLKRSRLSRALKPAQSGRNSVCSTKSQNEIQCYTSVVQAQAHCSTVGPGHYNILEAWKKSSYCKRPASIQMTLTSHANTEKKPDYCVGPQSYQTCANVSTLDKSGGYLSTEPFHDFSFKTGPDVGPGSYQYKSSIGGRGSGKFANFVNNDRKTSDSPGPGSYSVFVTQGVPQSIFPKLEPTPNKNPGPLHYQVEKQWKNSSQFNILHGSTFGNEVRRPDPPSDIPAPWDYDVSRKIQQKPGLAGRFGIRCYKEEL